VVPDVLLVVTFDMAAMRSRRVKGQNSANKNANRRVNKDFVKRVYSQQYGNVNS